MDEPDRSSTPPLEADDQPPPSRNAQGAPRTIELDLHDASGSLTPAALQELRALINQVLTLITNAGSVRVRVVNDDEMIEAHKRFSAIATTTDVLTFDMAHDNTDFHNKVLDTDLIICADEAQRQAQQRDHRTIDELLLYTLHGVLHCLGYDDHDEDDYKRMHAREDQLLELAGIGALFDITPTQEQAS
jgi:probable rRNA maturation factor